MVAGSGTAAQLGPAYATRIFGNAGGPGLNIVAKAGVNTRYAVSDSNGQFVFDGLLAGDWDVSVNGGAGKHAHVEPSSCVMLDLVAQ